MYAGIGLPERGSGDKIYSRQLTREFNRPLKNAIKKATEIAIHSNNNPFMRQYVRLTIQQGVPSYKAKLTVARGLLSTLYIMWKKGEEYDPDIDQKKDKGSKK
jgi:hypothetical protein